MFVNRISLNMFHTSYWHKLRVYMERKQEINRHYRQLSTKDRPVRQSRVCSFIIITKIIDTVALLLSTLFFAYSSLVSINQKKVHLLCFPRKPDFFFWSWEYCKYCKHTRFSCAFFFNLLVNSCARQIEHIA